MAAITPSTDLMLLKCPLEVDQQNQLTFTNATAQYNYFSSLPKLSVGDISYQRKDSTIRLEGHIDSIREYNYCMYRNDNYSNKWFYAFITDMKYMNDGVTLITIRTDVWQSWMFDIEVKASYVKREHVNDDTIGANTLDEGLAIGDPIVNGFQQDILASNDNESQRIVVQVSQLPDSVTVPSAYENRVYNGIPQGTYFLVFNGVSHMQNFIRWYDTEAKRAAVLAVFLVPKFLVYNAHYETYTISGRSAMVGWLPATYNTVISASSGVSYSATLDGYTPKNNKMYCYPYSYLYVSNNAGSDVIYRYEDFTDPTLVSFVIRGVLGQGCSIQAFPYNYKRIESGSDYGSYGAYGISCAKLPIISWTSDYYLNWQAQNGVNNVVRGVLGAASGLTQAVGGLATAATASSDQSMISGASQAIGGGISMIESITQAMHEDWKASLVPDQAMGNTNCSDLTYSMDKCGFTYRKMSCRREYAAMIDNFFSMFGYKVNKVKVPNVFGRTNWNYVQCVQANIIGDIPQDDMQEIKQLFNEGITFWHNPTTYLDYSQINAIV